MFGVTSLVSVEVIAGIRARLWGRDVGDIMPLLVSSSSIGTRMPLGPWATEIIVSSGAIGRSHSGFPVLPFEIGVVAPSHAGCDWVGLSWIRHVGIRDLHWRCDKCWL